MLEVRVVRAWMETPDVRSLELAASGGSELPGFAPGAHIDVHAPGGEIRQYSLLNGPQERSRFRIAVKREGRVSTYLHRDLDVGGLALIDGPRNSFHLRADATHSVLLAGGIGITPLLSMARHLSAARGSWELHYFVRSPAYGGFADLLAALGPAARLHVGLDPDATAGALAGIVGTRPAGSHLYVCGPTPFMDLAMELAAPAWPEGSRHREDFSPDPATKAGDAFEVTLARSRVTCRVGPAESILDALARHGFVHASSCEQGVCGTCLARVLEGTPEHRDHFLSEEERAAGDQLLPCVSRARGTKLVLDL